MFALDDDAGAFTLDDNDAGACASAVKVLTFFLAFPPLSLVMGVASNLHWAAYGLRRK